MTNFTEGGETFSMKTSHTLFCENLHTKVSFAHNFPAGWSSIQFPAIILLEDPGKARGCSTNTILILLVSHPLSAKITWLGMVPLVIK